MYKSDIESCSRDLEHVKIPKDKLCQFITQNMSQLFTILTKCTPRNRRKLVSGCCQVELQGPQFIDDLRTAINSRDWLPFYEKYRKHADTIIHEATRQRCLSILIEFNSEYYSNLESRDNAILPQVNNSERRVMDRPSTSVEERSHLLPELQNVGNNEAEISPGPRSLLEEFGEIAVIALEAPEESVVQLPGRLDQEQSTSLDSFSNSVDLQIRSPPFPASSSNEGNYNRLHPASYEEISEVGTSEIKVAEHKEELRSMLDSLRRNNEVQNQGEGSPSSTGVLKLNSSRANPRDDQLQIEMDRHEREMRSFATKKNENLK